MQHREFDANRVAANLWQGGMPPAGHESLAEEFDVIVLCAKQWQPPANAYPGIHVIRIPFDDDVFIDRRILHWVMTRTVDVRAAVDMGLRTLVTCMAGWNRSGFVSAMTMMRKPVDVCQVHRRIDKKVPSNLTAMQAVTLVRNARGQNALSNPTFVRMMIEFEPLLQRGWVPGKHSVLLPRSAR